MKPSKGDDKNPHPTTQEPTDEAGKLVSECCHADMKVVGDSFGEGTNHYECLECGQSCNWIDTAAPKPPLGSSQDAEALTAHSNEADNLIPESVCQICDGVNPVWFAPSPLWNKVMRYSDGKDTQERYQFVCPNCFIKEAEAIGINPTGWELKEEQPQSETARVWSAPTSIIQQEQGTDLAASGSDTTSKPSESAQDPSSSKVDEILDILDKYGLLEAYKHRNHYRQVAVEIELLLKEAYERGRKDGETENYPLYQEVNKGP